MLYDWLVHITIDEWGAALAEGNKSIAALRGNNSVVNALGASKRLTKRKVKFKIIRKFEIIKSNYERTLNTVIAQLKIKNLNKKDATEQAHSIMLNYFTQAYINGLQAQGTGKDKTIAKIKKRLRTTDKNYLRNAVAEELKYFKKFMRNISIKGTDMLTDERVKRYAQSLDGIQGSARVAALPADSLIWWTGPLDKRKCKSCTYLQENNPYMPHTLPTTPRAGDTLCLSNCRDRLVVRRAATAEIQEVDAGITRKEHVGILKRIKKRKAV